MFKGRADRGGHHLQAVQPRRPATRRWCRMKFKRWIEDKKRAAVEGRPVGRPRPPSGVRPGDTLPFMCFEVYGDPRHYLFVADVNRVDDFRRLTVGARSLPPLPPPAAADDRHLGDSRSGLARRVLGQRADRRHPDLRRVPRALRHRCPTSWIEYRPRRCNSATARHRQTFEASDTGPTSCPARME